jgi:hypothetical protein
VLAFEAREKAAQRQAVLLQRARTDFGAGGTLTPEAYESQVADLHREARGTLPERVTRKLKRCFTPQQIAEVAAHEHGATDYTRFSAEQRDRHEARMQRQYFAFLEHAARGTAPSRQPCAKCLKAFTAQVAGLYEPRFEAFVCGCGAAVVYHGGEADVLVTMVPEVVGNLRDELADEGTLTRSKWRGEQQVHRCEHSHAHPHSARSLYYAMLTGAPCPPGPVKKAPRRSR